MVTEQTEDGDVVPHGNQDRGGNGTTARKASRTQRCPDDVMDRRGIFRSGMRVFLFGKFRRVDVITSVEDARGSPTPPPRSAESYTVRLRCFLDSRSSRHETTIYKGVDLARKVCDCCDSPRGHQ